MKVENPNVAAEAKNARSFIELGLASYGRGELEQALRQWREALRREPNNDEAKKLVAFVEERMAAKTPLPSDPYDTREPSPVPNLDEAVRGWHDEEATAPGADVKTDVKAASQVRADVAAEESSEEVGERRRRPTLVSGLSGLLAPSTLPEAMRSTSTGNDLVIAQQPTAKDAALPVAEMSSRTSAADTPTPKSLNALARTATPLDVALDQALERAKVLVRQCGDALAAGKVQAAAAAAEEALEEAEKAPAPGLRHVIDPARSSLEKAFVAHLGRPASVPTMAVDDATVNTSNFDHRTGFLLSCIDGTLAIETLIDISGMSRFEAVRTLSKLLRRRIIKVS